MAKAKRRSQHRDGSLRAQNQAWRYLLLAEPPRDPARLGLWIQHAAGLILFERVRAAGMAYVDPALPAKTRKVAKGAVDAAMYALMMLIDGVSQHLRGDGHEVRLRFAVQLLDEAGAVQHELDLSEGDGFCMGYHGWRSGDFGEVPVVVAGAKPPPRPEPAVVLVEDGGVIRPASEDELATKRGSSRPRRAPKRRKRKGRTNGEGSRR